MIEVRLLEQDAAPDYQRVLYDNPRTMIYATPEYLNFLSSVVPGQWCCLVASESERVLGVLPYCRAEHPELGVVINSLPWYGSHGGCVLSSQEVKNVRQALLKAYAEAVSGIHPLAATMILTPLENEHVEEYRETLQPALEDHRIGQVTSLPQGTGEEEGRLLAVLTQKTRNSVRKSLRQGFSWEVTDEEDAWQFLYSTHATNMETMGGRAKPLGHFLALRKSLPPAWRKVWVAHCNGKRVAALLLLYFNRTVEYFTPVIVEELRARQPMSFLIYHSMLDAISNGFLWWNWGGTWPSQHSLHHFKAGWGAEDRPYTYLINVTGENLAWLRANEKFVQKAYPYYYTHPYPPREESA